jgi:hypothetical protein
MKEPSVRRSRGAWSEHNEEREREHLMVWKQTVPIVRNKSSINSLERRVPPLITPRKKVTAQLDLFESRIIDEIPEFTHEPTV